MTGTRRTAKLCGDREIGYLAPPLYGVWAPYRYLENSFRVDECSTELPAMTRAARSVVGARHARGRSVAMGAPHSSSGVHVSNGPQRSRQRRPRRSC